MSETVHDLVVIGGGPGGYVAAIRAAQLGLNVACIDENAELGGTCARVGCIPSKAMLESSYLYHETKTNLASHGVSVGKVKLDLEAMLKRKEDVVEGLTGGVAGLLKQNKVTVYNGRGKLDGPGKVVVEGHDNVTLVAENIILATGSNPMKLPFIEYDDDLIGTSTQALSYPTVPKTLVVVGAGYIGLELGSVWNRLGSEVICIDVLDRILPGLDLEIARAAQRILQAQGLTFHLKTFVERAYVENGKCIVKLKDGDPIECDRVLVATGRVPNTKDLNLESAGVQTNDRGFIEVGKHFQTSAAGIYAIGDCIGGAMLAHKASDEGIACVEHIVSGGGHMNYDAIPAVVYTHPEIASCGKTEQQLKEAGISYKKGTASFKGNGRARTLGETEGRLKILADADTDRVLGVHILGNRAGDMIAEAAVAMSFGATSEDIARVCHAHPTLAEALHEAALAVDDRAIHA